MAQHKWNGSAHRQLRLHLLGPFQAVINGNPPIRFRLDKCRLLLVYLALESDTPHSRDKLASLLWPNHSRADAKLNLRQTLHQLRRTLDEALDCPQVPIIITNRQEVQFNPAYPCWRDTEELGENLRQSRLEEAAALYRDDLLADIAVPGGEYSDWLSTHRATYRQRMCAALDKLVQRYQAAGNYSRALHFAERHVAIDPWSEKTHRQLMRILAADNRRGDALAHFEQLRRLLQSELGTAPEVETLRLHEQLLSSAPLSPAQSPADQADGATPQLGHLQRHKLEHLFRCIDRNADGLIDAQELHQWLSWSPVAEAGNAAPHIAERAEALHRMWWESMRGDSTERGVTLQHWLEFWSSWQAELTAEMLRGENRSLALLERSVTTRFEVLDQDRDGFITGEEYIRFLAARTPRENHRAAFERLDTDSDGRLTAADLIKRFREFLLSNDPEAPGNLLYGFPY